MRFDTNVFQRAALCALVLFSAFGVAEANAQPNEQQIAAYEAASEAERVKLLMFLAKNDADTAEWLLQTYPLQGKHGRNRTVFIKGLIQKSRGDLTGAAQTFRDALADDPSLTLVRAELAKTLVDLQEDDSAKHHLKLLEAEAPNDADAKGIQSFIDKVDARRPYTISGYVSLAPSNNLNSGSTHKTVYLPALGIDYPLAQPESGVGIAAGADVGYTKRLGNDFMFVGAAGVDGKIYKKHDYDNLTLSQSLEIRRILERGYIGFGGVASQSWGTFVFPANMSSLSYGPRISASYQITPQDSMNASAVYEWRKNGLKSGEDSKALLLNASMTHGFDSTLSATLFSGFEAVRNDNSLLSYDAYKGGMTVYKELPFGITSKLTAQVSQTHFKEINGILGLGKTRKDNRVSGTVNLTKRDLNIWGFAPSVEYTYSQNFSNSDVYDQINHSFDVRLTKDF